MDAKEAKRIAKFVTNAIVHFDGLREDGAVWMWDIIEKAEAQFKGNWGKQAAVLAPPWKKLKDRKQWLNREIGWFRNELVESNPAGEDAAPTAPVCVHIGGGKYKASYYTIGNMYNMAVYAKSTIATGSVLYYDDAEGRTTLRADPMQGALPVKLPPCPHCQGLMGSAAIVDSVICTVEPRHIFKIDDVDFDFVEDVRLAVA